MAFNKEALERGIEQCKNNIKTFEDAAQKERETIAEYYRMIEHNLIQETINKEKIASIEIIRED